MCDEASVEEISLACCICGVPVGMLGLAGAFPVLCADGLRIVLNSRYRCLCADITSDLVGLDYGY